MLHDVLGLSDRPSPRFAQRYADLWTAARDAVGGYAAEVRGRSFPTATHSFSSLATVPAKEVAKG